MDHDESRAVLAQFGEDGQERQPREGLELVEVTVERRGNSGTADVRFLARWPGSGPAAFCNAPWSHVFNPVNRPWGKRMKTMNHFRENFAQGYHVSAAPIPPSLGKKFLEILHLVHLVHPLHPPECSSSCFK